MSRHRCWTAAVLLLAACTSTPAADPTAPNDPPSTTKPAAPVNIAGEWIDTTTYPGRYVIIAHVTQTGATAAFTDTIYSKADSAYVFATASFDSAGVLGDTVIAGDCVQIGARPGQCVAGLDTAVVQGNTMAFVGNADNDVCPSNCALVRGTWTPPAPPSVIALNGVYMSDSLPWTALGEPCLGTIQIDLVIDKAGPGYPNAPAGGYMSTEYDRQCGGTWQAAIASWIVIDSGRVTNGVLSLSEALLPSGYTGPFTAAGNNWQLQAVTNDSLADITPSAINLGWRPPAFVYQPAGFYASASGLRVRRR